MCTYLIVLYKVSIPVLVHSELLSALTLCTRVLTVYSDWSSVSYFANDLTHWTWQHKPSRISNPFQHECWCRMTQIPVNVNDVTTVHKLQGVSGDVMIVTSWPGGGLVSLFQNWEYVVISRVRTLSGLYLSEPIDLEKSFQPSDELRANKYLKKTGKKSIEEEKNKYGCPGLDAIVGGSVKKLKTRGVMVQLQIFLTYPAFM